MSRYQVTVTPAARRQLAKLDPSMRPRIEAAVHLLAANPHPPDAKRLTSRRHELRVRVGDYRIIYEVHDARLVVLVVRVAHRREVYR